MYCLGFPLLEMAFLQHTSSGKPDGISFSLCLCSWRRYLENWNDSSFTWLCSAVKTVVYGEFRFQWWWEMCMVKSRTMHKKCHPGDLSGWDRLKWLSQEKPSERETHYLGWCSSVVFGQLNHYPHFHYPFLQEMSLVSVQQLLQLHIYKLVNVKVLENRTSYCH